MTQRGEAYAFFDCSVSRETIESEVVEPLRTSTPGLELTLQEMPEFVRTLNDRDLASFVDTKVIYPTFPEALENQKANARSIPLRDLRYALQVCHAESDNEGCAQGLGDVVNEIYARYGGNNPFSAAIVARIDGEYMFKDSD